jgi:hypothetical protein
LKDQKILGLSKEIGGPRRERDSGSEFLLALNLRSGEGKLNPDLKHLGDSAFVDRQGFAQCGLWINGIGWDCQSLRERPLHRKEPGGHFDTLGLGMHCLVNPIPQSLAPG